MGSHVARRLVATGADVRVMLRRSSSAKGIDALRAAMSGCDVVYYCELGWKPEPVEGSIRQAAVFFASRG